MTIPEDKIQQLFDTLEDIKRGIYGDKENKKEGLLDMVERHDKILKPLEYSVNIITSRYFWILISFAEIVLECNHVGIFTKVMPVITSMIK
jgi:hypothetical protein